MHVLQVGEQSAPTVQLLLTENTLVWILIQMFDQDVILYFSLRSELTGTMLARMRTTVSFLSFILDRSHWQRSTVTLTIRIRLDNSVGIVYCISDVIFSDVTILLIYNSRF
uniref:Uncharacterized protein n=1 Tax=Cacopsylla melanoneura TaxID=428564 RepID=A0A8D9FCC1_9HEMI